MTRSTPPGAEQSRRRARRITCLDGYHGMLSIGLWAAPSQGAVVMVPPTGNSVRFNREQAISFRTALDATIAELPSPGV